jgi:hypothetical protein
MAIFPGPPAGDVWFVDGTINKPILLGRIYKSVFKNFRVKNNHFTK